MYKLSELDRCHAVRPRMQRCTGCDWARYCSYDCARMNWNAHKSVCSRVSESGFNREWMKSGGGVFYKPISSYDFELARHLAKCGDGVHVYDDADFSEPHKGASLRACGFHKAV